MLFCYHKINFAPTHKGLSSEKKDISKESTLIRHLMYCITFENFHAVENNVRLEKTKVCHIFNFTLRYRFVCWIIVCVVFGIVDYFSAWRGWVTRYECTYSGVRSECEGILHAV